MAFYDDMAALAVQMLTEYGFSATVRAAATPSDPVTGAGQADGATRYVRAVQTTMDSRTFAETSIEAGDRMFVFGGPVEVGEYLVDGGDWIVKETKQTKPDNSTHIITKALVRG